MGCLECVLSRGFEKVNIETLHTRPFHEQSTPAAQAWIRRSTHARDRTRAHRKRPQAAHARSTSRRARSSRREPLRRALTPFRHMRSAASRPRVPRRAHHGSIDVALQYALLMRIAALAPMRLHHKRPTTRLLQRGCALPCIPSIQAACNCFDANRQRHGEAADIASAAAALVEKQLAVVPRRAPRRCAASQLASQRPAAPPRGGTPLVGKRGCSNGHRRAVTK